MSTTTHTTEPDTQAIITTIEQYLIDEVNGGVEYCRSKEIATALDLKTRQVAALIQDVNEMSTEITIEEWAYSKSTTWRIESTA